VAGDPGVTTWHVITGEFPPQPGGVSDYTRQLARGLADAGDRVEIWAPPAAGHGESHADDAGVTVHRLPDRFGLRSLRRLSRELDRSPAPRRLRVQYVPQSFGWKGANVPFCLWLRSRRRDSIWVMFHEVMFCAADDEGLRRQALTTVHRLMARLVMGVAERAFVSIPGWLPMLQPLLRPGATLTWLPVPSAIPVLVHPEATAAIRARYADGHPLVGHFGTYGDAVAALLERTLVNLAVMSDCHVLLLGDKSEVARRALIAAHPSLESRLFATGHLAARDLSHHVAACDLMLQPYPDGISSRRTSAMVALSHGRAIVTTAGWLTEPMWAEAGAAILAPVDDPHALAAAAATILFDLGQREEVRRRAATLYDARFHLRHTVAALRFPQ
jgi:glycosyl transferase family 4/glycosyl transferase family 1